MGLRRGGALVIRVGIQCMVVQIYLSCFYVHVQLRERNCLTRRLAKSVEFTACTGALLYVQKKIKANVRSIFVFISFQGVLAELWTNRKTTGRKR